MILIQKNMRRHIQRKKYLQLREATIVLQTATRALLARKLYRFLRETQAAIRVQRVWRGFVERKRYQRVRRAIVKIQAVTRGFFAWKRVFGLRQEKAATDIQRTFRGYQVRKERVKKIRKIVLIQSLWRRIRAKRELTQLRIEAKSLNKLMEVKYQLENKVFELSQKLVDRDAERGQLLERASHFEGLANTWKDKFERADGKIKELLEPAVQAKKDLADKEKMLLEKEKEVSTVDEARKQLQRQNSELGTKMKSAEVKILELEEIIKSQQEAYKALQQDLESQREEVSRAKEEVNRFKDDFTKQKELSEKLRKEIAKATPPVSQEEIEEYQEELARSKKEISKLKQQLSATGRTAELDQLRQENKRLMGLIQRQKLGQYANGPTDDGSAYDVPPDSRVMRNGSTKQLRALPASAQVAGTVSPDEDEDDDEEEDVENGYESDEIDDYSPRNSGDEAARLLEDDHLIEEIVDKLVRNLSIPSPNGDLDLQRREVFFSAHLIGVVAETMLKHGLVGRMQALMTNVMRAILSVTVKSNSDDYVSCFWLSNTYELWSIMVHLRDVDEKRRHKRQSHGRRTSEGSESESALIKIVNDLNYLIVDIFRGWMESMKVGCLPPWHFVMLQLWFLISFFPLFSSIRNVSTRWLSLRSSSTRSFPTSRAPSRASRSLEAGSLRLAVRRRCQATKRRPSKTFFNSSPRSTRVSEATTSSRVSVFEVGSRCLTFQWLNCIFIAAMSRQIVVELIRLIGFVSFNELMMRKVGFPIACTCFIRIFVLTRFLDPDPCRTLPPGSAECRFSTMARNFKNGLLNTRFPKQPCTSSLSCRPLSSCSSTNRARKIWTLFSKSASFSTHSRFDACFPCTTQQISIRQSRRTFSRRWPRGRAMIQRKLSC